eukprot:CAMPEP_0198230814 /NCGR_PEP_ID=MMETSP1445-20131203/114870_1 /TAXON_ID=36898 /ORGANISM="Pyramimonas sp., Strain CCMP2087" /LENGTH=40 /DNA_ID= /DNA_START= /DNA_END= /DNA_ORIENTATION=
MKTMPVLEDPFLGKSSNLEGWDIHVEYIQPDQSQNMKLKK